MAKHCRIFNIFIFISHRIHSSGTTGTLYLKSKNYILPWGCNSILSEKTRLTNVYPPTRHVGLNNRKKKKKCSFSEIREKIFICTSSLLPPEISTSISICFFLSWVSEISNLRAGTYWKHILFVQFSVFLNGSQKIVSEHVKVFMAGNLSDRNSIYGSRVVRGFITGSRGGERGGNVVFTGGGIHVGLYLGRSFSFCPKWKFLGV